MAEIISPADAENMSEFKSNPEVQRILTGAPPAQRKAETATPETPADDQEAIKSPEPEEGKSAATTGEAERKSSQGKHDKDRRDRSAEGRINEALAKAKAAEERIEKLLRENEELRKGTRKPEEPKPATEAPKTEAKASVQPIDDPKPKLSDFEKDPKYKTYGEAVEAFQDARDEWKDRQTAKADAEKTRKSSHDAKIMAARAKYPDLEEKIQAAVQATGNLQNAGIEAAMSESEHLGDLLYHLATNVDEYRRIAALSPQAAYREMIRLEIRLSGEKPEEKPPEPSKPIVSRAAAPPEKATGTGAVLDKSPAKEESMRDFKRNPEVQRILKRA